MRNRRKIRIAGFDPSLRNWGICIADYCTFSGKFTILKTHTVKTEFTKALKLPKNLKDTVASQTLYKQCRSFLSDVDIIVAEIPIGSKSASAMISYGICVGVLGSLTANGIALVRVTPQAVKKVVGYADATKEEVIAYVCSNHPELKVTTRLVKGKEVIVKSAIEHIADSIAALHAATINIDFINAVKQQGYIQMKKSYTLSQSNLAALVAAHVSTEAGVDVTAEDVIFAHGTDGVIAQVQTEEESKPAAKATTTRRATRKPAAEPDAEVVEDDEEEEEVAAKPARRSPARRKPAATVAEPDSDEDEDEYEDDEEDEAPAKTTRRPAARKTAARPAARTKLNQDDDEDIDEDEDEDEAPAKPVRRAARATAATSRRKPAAPVEDDEDDEDEAPAKPVRRTTRRTAR